MLLYVLFGLRKGDDTPEALVCWDEYCIDANPDDYEQAILDAIRQRDDFEAFRRVKIQVDGREILRLLVGGETLPGTIVKKVAEEPNSQKLLTSLARSVFLLLVSSSEGIVDKSSDEVAKMVGANPALVAELWSRIPEENRRTKKDFVASLRAILVEQEE